eukprot:6194544-Pleurochrysis_carterae.AAC.1
MTITLRNRLPQTTGTLWMIELKARKLGLHELAKQTESVQRRGPQAGGCARLSCAKAEGRVELALES